MRLAAVVSTPASPSGLIVVTVRLTLGNGPVGAVVARGPAGPIALSPEPLRRTLRTRRIELLVIRPDLDVIPA
ncbi:MAG: hypothetical protein KDC98_19265, partial [Planctomycetes bacterium]|nr:hypothetical protein [Planctomycetota bacterium]